MWREVLSLPSLFFTPPGRVSVCDSGVSCSQMPQFSRQTSHKTHIHTHTYALHTRNLALRTQPPPNLYLLLALLLLPPTCPRSLPFDRAPRSLRSPSSGSAQVAGHKKHSSHVTGGTAGSCGDGHGEHGHNPAWRRRACRPVLPADGSPAAVSAAAACNATKFNCCNGSCWCCMVLRLCRQPLSWSTGWSC